MNSIKRTAAALLLTLVLIAASALAVSAESTGINGKCSFNGNDIDSNFDSSTIAKAVTELQPGDDVTFTATYVNNYTESTDWYMENTVVQTLERTAAAKKHAVGTSNAENGGYTYELIQYDSSGNKNVLFSNDEVGGEAKPANMEGLEQATNALDDWFYIDTLENGESGKVVLHVAFDGETEVNDYMETDGELNVRFAVEVKGTPTSPPAKKVKTGDQSNLLMWSAIALIGGLLMIVLAFISRMRDRKAADKGGKA